MLTDDACSQLIHSLVTVRIATPCYMVCLILPCFDCKRFCKVVFPKMELLLVFSKNPKNVNTTESRGLALAFN